MPSRPQAAPPKRPCDIRDMLMYRIARLATIGDRKEIEKVTRGKSTEEAVKALIEKYGHYKS